MFILLTIKDVIEIEPAYFLQTASDIAASASDPCAPYYLSVDEILLHRVTERYVGKVVPGRGYCAAIASVVSATAGVIRGHAGSSWSSVVFEAVIFRPDVDEKIRGVIAAQTAEGIHVSIGFFDNVFVPAEALLQPGSSFDAERKVWTYSFISDDPTSPRTPTSPTAGKESRNDYQTGDEVLFAVKDVTLREVVSSEQEASGDDAPMKIQGSFAGSGLGPCAWF
jgi:DNA-directed RNA polymerase III subunit RPC8